MDKFGLYDPANEHESCGVGFIVDIQGRATHDIVQKGITILRNLEHRGAKGGDLKTGDGAGMLVQIPHRFFQKKTKALKITLPEKGKYGIGFLFLPEEKKKRKNVCELVESVTASEGGDFLGWRDVPVHPDCLGDLARKVMPDFIQFFVRFEGLTDADLERKLYVLRKSLEHKAVDAGLPIEEFYLPSLSCRVICYKGMFVAPQFEEFYPDLMDKDFVSPLALVHQRYSTNTLPSWPLAQPFRYMAHNGEINTLRGNINKMNAREATLSSDLFGEDINKLFPVVVPNVSDSASFDNAFELLIWSGRSVEHSLIMMMPEAFGSKYHMSADRRAFYEYHASIMEPWDGPAAVAFTDGIRIGAALDRNGLRPARYTVTKSGLLVLASETGVVEFSPEDVLRKGRLAPGKILVVDTEKKRVRYDNEVKAEVARRKPYRRWLAQNKIELKGLFQSPRPVNTEKGTLLLRQRIFGYTLETLRMILLPMVQNSQEPIGSMGNDEPLAVLSDRPQLLYKYFKQLFAQVTNPPIDPYRENLVMSLMSFVGKERNLLDETPKHCSQLKLFHPVLTNEDMVRIRDADLPDLKTATVYILMKNENLEKSLARICKEVENHIENGNTLVILSDRLESDMSECVPVPALLATSCVNHHLIAAGKRHLAGILLETGEAVDIMHFACLIGFGASAVNPYLVFESLSQEKVEGLLGNLSLEQAYDNYITAVRKGLLKVMSKMGVSTIRSYQGAQIFEAVGLDRSFTEKYFPGIASRIGGVGLQEIEEEARRRFKEAHAVSGSNRETLDQGGNYHFRRFRERHLFTPEAIVYLQKSVRNNDFSFFEKYSREINDKSRNLCTIRGLLKFKKSVPVLLNQVESADSIVKRFVTSAMSFGSISKEAHESMAIAMNRIGAQSNSGEGGESEERFEPYSNGDLPLSKVKQVASGRFGVNSNYLVHSEELQIKMAQGAKPGEGGQLPGHKVNQVIANVRNSTPGVMLISPPPHHDIYSIEDLAQLIFDLKNGNRDARISVKLVSEVGVGTIAAGVAKGKADMVLISGHDGGTGASPLTSIKYAGMPWEIGIAETQQTLVLNHLRDKIRVQADGQMRTGRDIVIGALLGAEEFGFGTVSLVALGCVMMRKCHLNTCPVGIATQREELRSRFKGDPDHIVNLMMFLAEDVRKIMADLGFRTFDEMVGRMDKLDMDEAIGHWKTKGLDFSSILAMPELEEGMSLYCTSKQEHDWSYSLDPGLLEKLGPNIKNGTKAVMDVRVKNSNRTLGAILSSEVSKLYGSEGLPEDTIHLNFTGSAGQSFGAFLAPGITFKLFGDTNDYTGKGLSGGRIIIRPPEGSTFSPHRNIISGNVNLFGATGGELFINGMAGERFAVRNSGAKALVEGMGDHGCEYMTGGRVISLGKTGVNFAAGMSGGIAYVLDENQLFDTKCNLEMVDLEPMDRKEDKEFVRTMIEKHVEYTASTLGKSILENWEEMWPLFVKVMPVDYRKALERIKREALKDAETVGMTEEVYA